MKIDKTFNIAIVGDDKSGMTDFLEALQLTEPDQSIYFETNVGLIEYRVRAIEYKYEPLFYNHTSSSHVALQDHTEQDDDIFDFLIIIVGTHKNIYSTDIHSCYNKYRFQINKCEPALLLVNNNDNFYRIENLYNDLYGIRFPLVLISKSDYQINEIFEHITQKLLQVDTTISFGSANFTSIISRKELSPKKAKKLAIYKSIIENLNQLIELID